MCIKISPNMINCLYPGDGDMFHHIEVNTRKKSDKRT